MQITNLTEILASIQELTEYQSLSSKDKIIILSNLILFVSKDLLPDYYAAYKDSLLSNGKELMLELQKHPDDVSLQLAIKAHLLLDLSTKLKNKD